VSQTQYVTALIDRFIDQQSAALRKLRFDLLATMRDATEPLYPPTDPPRETELMQRMRLATIRDDDERHVQQLPNLPNLPVPNVCGSSMTDEQRAEILKEATRLSTCGRDATALRERLIAYLKEHAVSEWVSVFQMCQDTEAWIGFGKTSVKLVLSTLEDVADMQGMPANYASLEASTCTKKSLIRLRVSSASEILTEVLY